MFLDFPRAYSVVRQGQLFAVNVCGTEGLIDLRTELELLRRFGAGATPKLIAALEVRRSQLAGDGQDLPGPVAEQVASLDEMRSVLWDALADANKQAIAEIDLHFPGVRTELSMDSIEQDANAFREEVADQVQESQVDDVDALLASFEQAAKEVEAPQAEAIDPIDNQVADPVDNFAAETAEAIDAAGEGLTDALVEDAAPADPMEAALAELAASAEDTSLADVEPAVPTDEPAVADAIDAAEVAAPVEAAAVEPDAVQAPIEDLPAPAEPVQALADAQDDAQNIETASQRVAESLTNTEEQLTAIASAFELAAAELGGMTDEVQAAAEPATTAYDVAAEEPVDLAGWGAEPTTEAAVDTPAAAAAAVPLPTVTVNVSPKPLNMSSTASNLRVQIQQVRTGLLSQLDDLLILLERADQTQIKADESMQRARLFEQAAAKAQQANQALNEAETQAVQARMALEQAETRVQEARRGWEDAQKEAAAVTAQGR